MTDDQRKIRDLESAYESEQIEVDMLENSLWRIRAVLGSDKAPSDMLDEIRYIAHAAPGAPDIAA